MANPLIDYFNLRSDVAAFGGAGKKRANQGALFIAVLAGAACKLVYDSLQNGTSLDWRGFVIAAIASTVVFPYVYRNAGLNRGPLTLAKWTLGFQNGFFWSVAMAALTKST